MLDGTVDGLNRSSRCDERCHERSVRHARNWVGGAVALRALKSRGGARPCAARGRVPPDTWWHSRTRTARSLASTLRWAAFFGLYFLALGAAERLERRLIQQALGKQDAGVEDAGGSSVFFTAARARERGAFVVVPGTVARPTAW